MKALCCICFNHLDGSHIAACPCGHTFHEECLMRWIDTSSTCPYCRTHVNKEQIIKRLFFNINEHCDEDVDVAMMLNQINNLTAQLSDKDKQRQELVESRDRLSTMFADSEAARELLLTKLTQEKNSKDVMERDLKVMLRENIVFLKQMKKIRKIVKDCKRLPNFETLIEECWNHVKKVFGPYSTDGESSLRHLNSFLTDLKFEYYQVLSEKTSFQNQVSELKSSAEHNKIDAEAYRKTIIDLRTCLKTINEVVIEMQRQNPHFYKKIVALKGSIVGYDTGTEKILQEMKDLRKKYTTTCDTLSKVMSEKTVLEEGVPELIRSFTRCQCRAADVIITGMEVQKSNFASIHKELQQTNKCGSDCVLKCPEGWGPNFVCVQMETEIKKSATINSLTSCAFSTHCVRAK